MPAIKAEFLGATHHRIIKHPIKFLGITIGYRREVKLETYSEGLKRTWTELDVLYPDQTHYSKVFR